MHRIPNRKLSGFILVALLIVLTFTLSPAGSALAAVNQNFDSFTAGNSVDSTSIPNLTMTSSPANSTKFADLTASLTTPFSGLSLQNTTAGAGGTLTIAFPQPQASYAFDFATDNLGTAASNVFTVQGLRAGGVNPVFTDTYNNSNPNIFQGSAAGTSGVFDELLISSTTETWALDNLVTTDSGTPAITIIQSGNSTDVAESGSTTDSYSIALDTIPAQQVDIDLVVTSGQCNVLPSTVTIPAGSIAPQTVTVGAVDDQVDNAPDLCTISQTVRPSSDPAYTPLSIPDLIVIVTDDDTAGVNIVESGGITNITEAGGTDSYTVVLTSDPTAPVSITISPDSNCTVSPAVPLIFNPTTVGTSLWSTPQTVTVTAVDNQVHDGTHDCVITHSASNSGTDPNYTPPMGIASVTAHIADNDTAGVTIGPLTPASLFEQGSTTADYDISLDTDPQQNVSVAISADPTQCQVNGGATTSLTFFAGSGSAQTVTVTAIDDAIAELPPQNCLITNTFTSADTDYTGITRQFNAPIVDNDAAGIDFTPLNGPTVIEGGGTDTYNLSLQAIPTADVIISITPGPECTIVSPASPITVPSGTTGPVVITVQAVDDAVIESSLVYPCVVKHQVTSSGDAAYAALPEQDHTVNITDNDAVPGYTSTPNPSTALTTINTTAGTPATATLLITEAGTADLVISNYLMQPASDPELTVSGDPLPIVLAANSGLTTTLTVTCDSAVAGTFNGMLEVDHNAPGSPATYPVLCNVTAPAYSSSPDNATPITITTTQGTNATTTITVTNTGNAQLDVGTISVTGDPELTLITSPNLTLVNNGDSDLITIQCDATNTGSFTTQLNVPHNGVGTPVSPVVYTVNCQVNPVASPVFSSSPPTPMSLTTTQGTNTSATITVTNTGFAQLDVGTISVTGDPELTLITSPNLTLVNNGDSDLITIQCDATNSGIFTTQVNIPHNGVGAPASPVVYTVNCQVNPSSAPIFSSSPPTVPPISLTTTQGTNITTTITVTNTGNAQLDVGLISLSGNPELTLTTLANFSLVNQNDSGPITIQCNAANTGSFTTQVSIPHNGFGAPTSPVVYTVNCQVNPILAPAYSSVPDATNPIPITATQGAVASTTITVTNAGNAQLDVGTITLSGNPELTLTTATTFSILNNGGTAPITIACNTTNTGTFTTQVTVPHNGVGTPTSPVVYTVNCQVNPASGPIYSSLPTAALPIPITATQGAAASTTITVTNTGNAQLDVGTITLSGNPELTLTTATTFSILNNGGTAAITIACNTTNTGTFTTQVTVPHNGVGTTTSPVVYTVNCNVNPATGPIYSSTNPAPGGTLTITPTGVGSAASGTVTVKNIGNADLHITVSLDPTSSTHLQLLPPSQQTITAGLTGDIVVQCDANFSGTAAGKLIVTHDGVGTPTSPVTYTINCTIGGTTGPGYGSVPPPGSILNLGTVLIGSPIATTLVVSETGNATLTVFTSSIVGANAAEFSITSGAPLFNILDGGASQTIVIQCIPSTEGLRLATLTFITNDTSHFTGGSVSYLLACVGSTVPVTTPTPIGFVPSEVAPTATVIIPATGQVTEVKGLSVRTGPYLGATLINVARPGTTYSILARNRDEGSFTWYLIQIGRQTGWVSGRFLTVSGTIDAIPFAGSIFDQIDNAPDIGVRVTTNAIIDLRRRPSPRVPRVGTIPANTEVIVLGVTQEGRNNIFWIQVSYNGIIGWIPALPVTMRGPTATLPVR